MRGLLKLLLVLVIAAVAYLAFWPVPLQPQAWTPPVAPATDAGPYAVNTRLHDAAKLAAGFGRGPEGLALDAQGNVYAGFDDGRVVRFDANGANPQLLLDTKGRPLGLCAQGGGLWIADAKKGLLHLDAQNQVDVTVTGASGVPFAFTDDVDVAPDGQVYFSDASSRFGIDNTMADVLEHGASGRLLRYDPVTKQTSVVKDGFYFANGVAVGPNGDYVLVNETTAYRVSRVWLKGEKAGQSEVFIDNLPGFPDNLSFNGKDRFWVALYAPRTKDLDSMLPHPALRKLAYRLPAFLQPKPARHGFVVGLDLDGHVVTTLQDPAPDSYSPITSAEQFGDWLYLGSLSYPAIGRVSLGKVLAQ